MRSREEIDPLAVVEAPPPRPEGLGGLGLGLGVGLGLGLGLVFWVSYGLTVPSDASSSPLRSPTVPGPHAVGEALPLPQ